MGFELNIRIYILLICIPLIPLGIIRNLKNLVLFSAVATIFIIVGIAFTLYFTGKLFFFLGRFREIVQIKLERSAGFVSGYYCAFSFLGFCSYEYTLRVSPLERS